VLAWIAAASLARADQGAALAEPSQLERARQDPEHFDRLRQDLNVFLHLPPEEQERLRRLDRDLHALNSSNRARLYRALERYASWLETLSDADRQHIAGAADDAERLRRIKEMRQRQWLANLPKAYRDRLDAAGPDMRATLIQTYQQEDLQRRRQWQAALRHWEDLQKAPAARRLKDYPPAVQTFVNEHLRPRLTAEEEAKLHKAEGNWPLYPQTLVELADKHPLLLPGPAHGPMHFKELPQDVQSSLLAHLKPAQLFHLASMEGKWPDYAFRVTEIARRNKVPLPHQLGPARPADFPPSIQKFVTELQPILEPEEKTRIEKAEGHWPNYPRTILELARRHQRPVPGMSLPGPREAWDRFRSQAPGGTSAK
jgi:hypothetical protein